MVLLVGLTNLTGISLIKFNKMATTLQLNNAADVMNPCGYAEKYLKIKLHTVHKQVLNSLLETGDKSRVSFVSANGCGKTSTVAAVAILYAIDMLNCNVIATSGVYRQLITQLMPSIKRYANLYSNWEFQENKIVINNEIRFLAYSPDNQKTAQGYHNTLDHNLLAIVDEAAAVADDIYLALMERCQPKYLLITGSPLNPEGIFYSIEYEPNLIKTFTHFKLTKLQCLKKDGWWLDESEITETISRWGREHPIVLSSIFAEFTTMVEGGLITLKDIEGCLRTPPIPDYSCGKHVALDFARGGDSNVIAFRNGNEVKIIKEWKELDTMQAARQFVAELDNLKYDYKITAGQVSGDADGLGGPIIDRIKELGWKINEFHGNSAPVDGIYKNNITEKWITACNKIRSRSIIIPNNQELKMQLTSRKSFMTDGGKLMLESKKDMKERGIPSPDIADAVAMCIGEPSAGCITFARTPLPVAKSYKGYF